MSAAVKMIPFQRLSPLYRSASWLTGRCPTLLGRNEKAHKLPPLTRVAGLSCVHNGNTPYSSSFIRPRSTKASEAMDVGFFSKVAKKIGIVSKYRYPRYILRRSGLRIYMCCTDMIDQEFFIKELGMDDTFTSWFKILELHIWMLMFRLAQEGQDGKFVTHTVVASMWEDLDKRMKQLGDSDTVSMTNRREGKTWYDKQFKWALISYDEGFLSDDKTLAAALWRTFFSMKCEDPEKLEILVEYVRKQIQYLDNQESTVLLQSGLPTFLPLFGTKLDLQQTKESLKAICEAV